jgi:hypothetical protein
MNQNIGNIDMITNEEFLQAGGVFFVTETKNGFIVKAQFSVEYAGRVYEGCYESNNLFLAKENALSKLMEHRSLHLKSAQKSGYPYKDVFFSPCVP